MSVLLAYDMTTILRTYRVTYRQTHSYNDAPLPKDELRLDVIAESEEGARHWAEQELNSHGDIHDIANVAPTDWYVPLAYESYLLKGEEYYVLFESHKVDKWRGPFRFEHQANAYALTLHEHQNPKVVVMQKEEHL